MTVGSNSFTLTAKARNGNDGAGTERVYIRTKTNVAPVIADSEDPLGYDSNGHGPLTDGYLPMAAAGSGGEVEENAAWTASDRGQLLGGTGEYGECTGEPSGVSAAWPFEWEKERRLGTPGAQGVRTWIAYSGQMSLHKNWASDAVVFAIECRNMVKPGDEYMNITICRSKGDDIQRKGLDQAISAWGVYLTALPGSVVVESTSDSQLDLRALTITKNTIITLSLHQGSASGTVVATKEIRGVEDGHSIKGDTGKMCYIAGPYDPRQTYTSNAQQTVAVEYEYGGETEIWTLAAATNVVNGVHYGPRDGGNYWTQGLNKENIIRAKYLFADFANMGSFIVSRDFFFSQYGTLAGPGGDIAVTSSRTAGKVYMKTESDGKKVPYYAIGSSSSGDKPCYLFFDARDPMASDVLQGGLSFTLEGNQTANLVAVKKVYFHASAATTVRVTVTPSSEAGYDFGAVGNLDATDLSADGMTSAEVENDDGTLTLVKASGTTAQSATVSVGAGWHFFEIAYLKDGSQNSNLDKAGFTFAETGGNHISGFSMLEFRPMKVVNALTGEEWMAQGNVHVSQAGDVEMNNAVIRNAALYHGVKTLRLESGNQSFYVYDNDYSPGVVAPHFVADTFILAGDNSTSNAEVLVGLPQPQDCEGMRLKVIRGRHTSSHRASLILGVVGNEESYEGSGGETWHWTNGIYDPDGWTAAEGEYDMTQLQWVELTVGSALPIVSATEGYIGESFKQWIVTGKG